MLTLLQLWVTSTETLYSGPESSAHKQRKDKERKDMQCKVKQSKNKELKDK
jgi:hypothetical protein